MAYARSESSGEEHNRAAPPVHRTSSGAGHDSAPPVHRMSSNERHNSTSSGKSIYGSNLPHLYLYRGTPPSLMRLKRAFVR